MVFETLSLLAHVFPVLIDAGDAASLDGVELGGRAVSSLGGRCRRRGRGGTRHGIVLGNNGVGVVVPIGMQAADGTRPGRCAHHEGGEEVRAQPVRVPVK